jgi:tetratricopeptide (TPR) repeat protein
VLLVGLAAVTAACGARQDATPAADSARGATIPRTSVSAEAIAEFESGLALVDRLRFTDARSHFQQAVTLDPNFAWAHLMLAQTSPTAPAFWSELKAAQAAAGSASEGERLVIEAFTAGVDGHPELQQQLLEQLVAAHPKDPRSKFALATFHFGRQNWDAAIAAYQEVNTLAPDFSPPYNQLGYALRSTGDFDGAEAAFRRYVELIPDEPNPYDSLAELLMKRGRFEESIATYRQALEQDLHFISSYVGIGNNLMMLGRGDEARAAFGELAAAARTDGERRQAITWKALSYLHEGNHEAALAAAEERAGVARGGDDRTALSADLNLMGNILLDAGRLDEAAEKFDASVAMIASSDATEGAKDATRRTHLFDTGRVALARGDIDGATAIADDYRQAADGSGVRFELWQSHELAGMVALARNDPEAALAEFALANPQDPRVMFLRAKANVAAGNADTARALASQAASFNGLSFTWPYVRAEAQKLATS